MGVEAEAKASGRCYRASEESKTRSRRRGHQPVTKTTLTPEKVKDQQTQEKDDEPRRSAETAFAAHKHLRHLRPEAHPLQGNGKRQQGDLTCKPRRQHLNWSTLTQGAKPQLSQQASGAGEAQKKKGRAEAQPTSPGKQKYRSPVTRKP